MTRVAIEGASKAQAKVLGILLGDVASVLGRQLRVSFNGRASLRIYVSNKEKESGDGYDAGWLGYYCDGCIYLRPYLRGATLYRVALHELGHFWQLNHGRQGVMAVAGHIRRGSLKLSHRKKLLREMAKLLMYHKLRNLA